MKKRWNCCYLHCVCAVRSRNHCKYHGFWGSGRQKHCNLQCFLNQRLKTPWYLRCFHSPRNIKHRNLPGFWQFCSWPPSMQKTEKHWCFSYHKTTKISPKTGPKIRLWARPPAEPQKKNVADQKVEVKKLKNPFFFTCRLPIWDGRVHEQVSSVLFFTVFFEGERHDLSKTGGFGRKMSLHPQVNL